MKKAELSINMIIVAVIAIVILVIIIFLVTRSASDTKNSTACNSKGGVCTESAKCDKQIYDSDGDAIKCTYSGEVCCSITAISG